MVTSVFEPLPRCINGMGLAHTHSTALKERGGLTFQMRENTGQCEKAKFIPQLLFKNIITTLTIIHKTLRRLESALNQRHTSGDQETAHPDGFLSL